MVSPPADFRSIDIHTHLHPPRLNEIDVSNDDLVRWQDRIVFGSDFPNLPYSYEDERDALWQRDLPMPVSRKIFHDNAARLLGL